MAALIEHSPAPTQTMEQQVLDYHANKKVERLTGFTLLDHNKRGNHYSSRAELIKAAGYTRIKANGEVAVAFTAYYEAILDVKSFIAMRENMDWAYKNPSKSPAIRALISNIIHQNNYKYRTDAVLRTCANFYRKYEDRDLNVYHQGKLVASIDFKRKVVILRISEGTRSTKERLNRILMHLCGVNLFGNKTWHIVNPYKNDIKVTGIWTEVPFVRSWFQ